MTAGKLGHSLVVSVHVNPD